MLGRPRKAYVEHCSYLPLPASMKELLLVRPKPTTSEFSVTLCRLNLTGRDPQKSFGTTQNVQRGPPIMLLPDQRGRASHRTKNQPLEHISEVYFPRSPHKPDRGTRLRTYLLQSTLEPGLHMPQVLRSLHRRRPGSLRLLLKRLMSLQLTAPHIRQGRCQLCLELLDLGLVFDSPLSLQKGRMEF
jgi:hypothetical protein